MNVQLLGMELDRSFSLGGGLERERLVGEGGTTVRGEKTTGGHK